MNDKPKLSTMVQKTLDLANRCAQGETSDSYGMLGDQIETLEAEAREVFQSKLSLAVLLQKLRAAKPLSPADLKTLELLIVGDADRSVPA